MLPLFLYKQCWFKRRILLMYVQKTYIKLLTELLKEYKVTFCCVWMYIYIYIIHLYYHRINKGERV